MTLKAPYLTGKNHRNKIASWKKKLSPYKKRWKEFAMENSALMIIDMQNYFLKDDSHAFVPTGTVILKNISTLLHLYREKGLPVIFTYFAVQKEEEDPIRNWWSDTVYDGTQQSELIEELQPQNDELVLRKPTYNSFHGTELETFLKGRKVQNLVITGVLTNLCCETTAREAFVRNFDVFFVMDATAAYNEEMHLSGLMNLSYGFATPICTSDI